MKKYMFLAIGLAAVLASVGLGGCSPGSTVVEGISLNNQQQGIWVTGQGEVAAVPDSATPMLGVEAQQAIGRVLAEILGYSRVHLHYEVL